MIGTVRRGIEQLLAAPGMTAPFYPAMRNRATILMLHRFEDPARGIHGDDPGTLRRTLAMLRRRRYELVPLLEVYRRLRGDGPPLRRAVAFTIDDGYAEQAEVGGPVFAEFDCPVTTFVTTGFLDGALWFWWDRITWILRSTRRDRFAVDLGGRPVALEKHPADGWTASAAAFTEACKLVPDGEKVAAIGRLAAAAAVDVPAAAPPEFAPMSWSQLRRCEEAGMTFGPHTLTHPVLSRTDDAQSQREIAGSWQRLGEEARAPVPVFCYPNGGAADFGSREIATLRSAGFEGAVMGVWGVADARDLRGSDPEAPFRVLRLPYPGDVAKVVQYVSGVEVVKLRMRGGR